MPDASRVHLIVFSKDRPLQLHGMLESVFRHWRGDFTVSVLVRRDSVYAPAYVDVAAEFRGRASFVGESSFADDLDDTLRSEEAPYVCFGTDDVVFTREVRIGYDIHPTFMTHPKLLGYSLRLGEHTKADMFGREMPRPRRTDCGHAHLTWDAEGGTGDWGYPWEVLGTVYRTEYVRQTVGALVADGQVQNPSTLEDAGWRRWREFAGGRSEMVASYAAHLVVPTVNVVQSVFGNGIVGPGGLDAAFLLDCWNRGLRLDVERYRGMTPPSWRIPDFFLRRAG